MRKTASKAQSTTAASGTQVQSYAQMLAKSDTQKSAERVEYLVETASHSLGQAISNTKFDLSTAKNQRREMLSNENINWASLAALDDKIEGLSRGLERLEGYKSELFPG